MGHSTQWAFVISTFSSFCFCTSILIHFESRTFKVCHSTTQRSTTKCRSQSLYWSMEDGKELLCRLPLPQPILLTCIGVFHCGITTWYYYFYWSEGPEHCFYNLQLSPMITVFSKLIGCPYYLLFLFLFPRKCAELEEELKNVTNNLKSLEAQAEKVGPGTAWHSRVSFGLARFVLLQIHTNVVLRL